LKTSVIHYRVADFLREHPPFDVIPLADLLTFSASGRVVFHEDDIYLFRKGEPCEAMLWVVQQGRIEMLDEIPAGEQLRDVLGPGDILGLKRHAAETVYQQTARTATEVILYTFDLSAFETLTSKYPETGRFLTAHLSAAARHTKALQLPVTRARLLTEQEKAVWLHAPAPSAQWLTRRSLSCAATLPVRAAAEQMAEAQSDAIAIVAANGHPLGLITNRELRDQIATGLIPLDAPAETIMNRRFPTAPTGLPTADYLLRMLCSRSPWLAITANGTAASPLQGLIVDTDLELTCGKNPVLLLREMLTAKNSTTLAYLWQRAEALLAETLVGPSVVEWLAQMISELRAVLLERVVQMASTELARAGQTPVGVAHCWLLFGAAGRRELMTSIVPELGLVYADPPPSQAAAAEKYFSMLAQTVMAKLIDCGLRAKPTAAQTEQHPRCQSLTAWKEFYQGQIRDPIGSQIYTAREYFDFHVVAGEAMLGAELQRLIGEELARSEAFIPVLANDTIAKLPPLTFYLDAVLETDGRANRTLDAEQTALTPLTDATRVLAFTTREVASANTLERLQQLAKALPQYTSTLTDAAEAWRIVCYHHTLAGLSQPGGNALIYSARLSRFEQRLLKTAFDSTRRLVELAASLHQRNGSQ
jgi:CBS domain-containing protein